MEVVVKIFEVYRGMHYLCKVSSDVLYGSERIQGIKGIKDCTAVHSRSSPGKMIHRILRLVLKCRCICKILRTLSKHDLLPNE